MKFKGLLFFCFLFQYAHAQSSDDKDQFFVFDKNWNAANVKKATYFLRVRQTNDSNWEWLYYNVFGPRIKLENYKDSGATIRNGKFTYYFPKGTIDSLGNYFNGEPDGEWHFLNEKGQMIRKKTYDKGVLLSDSTFTPKGTKDDKEKKYETNPGDVESEYPGGQAAWARFLRRNLTYPDRALNNNIQGEVILQFIIDKEGTVIQPDINRSVEYSLDEESLRIIGICGKWSSAFQNGRKVKSYKRQPIIFSLH